MPFTDLLISQLTDIFRIGLLVALTATMLRTRADTGIYLPLAAGVIFIALMIPMTLPGPAGEPFWRIASTGLVSNIILLGMIGAAFAVYRQFRR
jgi:hypothetical protein